MWPSNQSSLICAKVLYHVLEPLWFKPPGWKKGHLHIELWFAAWESARDPPTCPASAKEWPLACSLKLLPWYLLLVFRQLSQGRRRYSFASPVPLICQL